MKKLIVLILVVALLSNTCVIAFAEDELLYEDKFRDYIYDSYETNNVEINYDELYYHKNKDENIDWVMIYALCKRNENSELTEFSSKKYSYNLIKEEMGDRNAIELAVFGDVVFYEGGAPSPFQYTIGIYDLKDNKFYDLLKAWEMEFEDLHEAFNDVMTTPRMTEKKGLYYSIIGDLDEDGQHTIKDVTKLQRCLAGMTNFKDIIQNHGYIYHSDRTIYEYYYPDTGYTCSVVRLADYNADGKVNISDATAIQKKIAKVS